MFILIRNKAISLMSLVFLTFHWVVTIRAESLYLIVAQRFS